MDEISCSAFGIKPTVFWRLTHRNLASLFCEILPHVIQRCWSALSVKTTHVSVKRLVAKWVYGVRIQFSALPSDLQTLLIVWMEELKGFVDLHALSPVLANIELCGVDKRSLFARNHICTTVPWAWEKPYLWWALQSSSDSGSASSRCRSSPWQEGLLSQSGSDSWSYTLEWERKRGDSELWSESGRSLEGLKTST